MTGTMDVAGLHGPSDRLELEDQFLEPQLEDLMHDDEEKLVVRRRLRQQLLLRQELGDPQV